jgi:hypothetical protein
MIMNLKRLKVLIWVLAISASGCANVSSTGGIGISVKPGDLLFRDSDCGPLCDAIEKVTTGYHGANLSHVGIAAEDESGKIVVIEAVSKGVVASDLQTFLKPGSDPNGQPRVMVGRLRGPFRNLIPAAIKEAEALKGKPYDKAFVIDNDAYYCSELIYEIFRRANGGEPVFMLEPMTFKDPETGQTLPAWQEYFAKLGIDIPQGMPGINPGGISRSPALTIVYAFGRRM